MFSKQTIGQIETVAREAGIEPAALLAIAEVESGGCAFATVDGRREPLIRFEGHYFDRRLQGRARDEARSGVAGQMRLMLRFLEKNGLIPHLKARNWAGFARRYNGPKFRVHKYDERMADAYARHSENAVRGPVRGVRADLLRTGDRGAAVADLQHKLAAAGYAVTPDGMFGPATTRAVERYQKDHGLAADGIVGPATTAALDEAGIAPPAEGPLARLTALQLGISGIVDLFR
jgi:hypothetical protein